MHRKRFMAVLFTAAVLACHSAYANLNTGSENVSGNRNTPQYEHDGKTYGPYGWTFSYTRGFDGLKLYKHVEIDFEFDAELGWDDAQKAAYKAGIEAAIEGIWNNKFKIKDENTGKHYALTVDVTTTGPFNQTVKVHKGDGRADMLNWYETDTGSINAHEFGHMLGLYDEYMGGAVDKYPNPTLSDDGLMGLGALNANPVMYERYYQQYLDYMKELNKGGTFTMVRVPAPSSAVLCVIGLVFVGLRRRTPELTSSAASGRALAA